MMSLSKNKMLGAVVLVCAGVLLAGFSFADAATVRAPREISARTRYVGVTAGPVVMGGNNGGASSGNGGSGSNAGDGGSTSASGGSENNGGSRAGNGGNGYNAGEGGDVSASGGSANNGGSSAGR